MAAAELAKRAQAMQTALSRAGANPLDAARWAARAMEIVPEWADPAVWLPPPGFLEAVPLDAAAIADARADWYTRVPPEYALLLDDLSPQSAVTGLSELLFFPIASDMDLGGEGSGHYGHQGRKGRRGGSLPGGGSALSPNLATWRATYIAQRADSPQHRERFDEAAKAWQKQFGDSCTMGALRGAFEVKVGNLCGRIENVSYTGHDHPPTFTVSGHIHEVSSGKCAGYFMRTLKLDGTMVNNGFSLYNQHQKTGFGGEFYRRGEALARRIGMREVEVYADSSTGGYSWARMGFDFASEDTRHNFANFARQRWDFYYRDTGKPCPLGRDETVRPWQIAALAGPDGQRIGKEIMLGSDWDGVKRLGDDDEGERVGLAYFRERKRHARAEARGMEIVRDADLGGPGSGHRGHKGRKGQVGGSVAGTGGPAQSVGVQAPAATSGALREAMRADGAARNKPPGVGEVWMRPETGAISYANLTAREGWSRDEEPEIGYDDFDPDAEWRIIQQVVNRQRDVLSTPEGRQLAMDIDEDGAYMADNAAAGNRVGLNIIFTYQREDVGMGVGGPGTARVFWMPYSLTSRPGWEDRVGPNESRYAYCKGLDPVYVLNHETHHAFGSHSELDVWSDVMFVDSHLALGNKLHPTAVKFELQEMIWLAQTPARGGLRKSVYKYRKGMKWLLSQHPEAVRQHLKNDGADDDYIARFVAKAETW